MLEHYQHFLFQLQKFKTPRPIGTSEWSHMLVLTFQVLVYVIFGTIVFILLPAIVFTFVEGEWRYLDSVYFAFITLTTIGFGDLVAGNFSQFHSTSQKYLFSSLFLHANRAFICRKVKFSLEHVLSLWFFKNIFLSFAF